MTRSILPLLLALAPTALPAQTPASVVLRGDVVASAARDTARPPPRVPEVIGSAFTGGLIGAVVLGGTAWLATLAANDGGPNWWSAGAGVFGATFGYALGQAAGAHLGNGRRGNFAHDLLASVVVSGVALYLAYEEDAFAPVLAVPLVGLAVTVPLEIASGRYRTRTQ